MGGPKKQKLQPRLPRGFADRGPEDIRAVERMMEKIKGVYERYGFEPVETPFVEYTEALGKFLPDQDRPNEGVFSFQDDDEEWLSLRYDLTAPLARYVAQNFEALPKPYRSYRQGWVFRNEKPGPGRYRQFMQFDADTVGAASVAADAEICMMAADTMEALGFARGQYVIKFNSRKVLDGLMEVIGLAGEENAKRKLVVLRAIDKIDRLGIPAILDLLTTGRTDESGDRTEGAQLSYADAKTVINFVTGAGETWSQIGTSEQPTPDEWTQTGGQLADTIKFKGMVTDLYFFNSAKMLDNWNDALARSAVGQEGVAELKKVLLFAQSAGYGSARIRIGSDVVRGLEYYTGPVFEAQLTFEVPNEKGEPVVFGSVGGGGRYDGLVGRFRGEDVPATGFSVGVSRLASALKAIGKLGGEGATGPVVVTVMDRARMAEYQRMVSELRNAGIASEMYLGGSGMKAQLKYADKRNAPCVIIQGSQEAAEGKVQIKDLAAGKEQAAETADNRAWREERPGQFEVPRQKLVEAVRSLLAGQNDGASS